MYTKAIVILLLNYYYMTIKCLYYINAVCFYPTPCMLSGSVHPSVTVVQSYQANTYTLHK